MTTPIRIADLQQLAEMHRNSVRLDPHQEANAFAGLDALLDLALAVKQEREAQNAYRALPDGHPHKLGAAERLVASAEVASRAIAALDFTGARR